MHLRTRTWFVISLLCFVAAAVFWQLGERKSARDRAARESAKAATNSPAVDAASSSAAPVPAVAPVKTNTTAQVRQAAFPHRLTNTTMTVDQLSRSASGLILRNALIDSSAPLSLNIPAHLRAEGDPGSYVVQSRGPVTEAFRAALQQAGAEVVAYVPNNAYLVRADEGVARQLGALPTAQAVLPWEPYYKIDPALLEVAVKETALPSNTRLNLLLFPGEREAVLRELSRMEAVVLGEERSPFGWQLMVRPPEGALVSLAQLPGVQVIERLRPRRVANDLARTRVRVTTNSLGSTPNYLNLRGAGIKVNVNDTGVDWIHPDLQGRVTADLPSTFDDFEGHGTHVAGTIASSGASGPSIPPRNIPGSVTNANFRGMAPDAEIFALPLDRTFGPDTSDSYLQETAAAAEALISNNSWGYFGSGTYTLAAASWDAAVRDALPGVIGPQPMITVFSAGNRGAGGIDAPGTAKNVITVGAIENMRVITNEVRRGADPNFVTNQPWLGMTDTNNEVAAFSSLGNVNPGEEGAGGRFKPDVVAPGTFVVSTRSHLWQESDRSMEVSSDQVAFVRIRAGRTNLFSTFIPENGVRLQVVTVPNADSPAGGLPPLPIQIRAGEVPTAADFVGVNNASVPTVGLVPDTWFFSVANTNDTDVFLNIRYFVTLTNDAGNEPQIFAGLNGELAPYYRYETGTSMAAPVVTGLIALMQEFFTRRLQWTNSPALMKALLINGARSVNSAFDFNTTNSVNGQGWGLANLTNSIPAGSIAASGDGLFTSSSMVLYDQHPDRALATGQSFTRTVTVAARTQPLRITLVWTDPPGNPAVGIKLVNNLDLVVTNLDTGEIFVGNGIGGGSIFNAPVEPGSVTFDTVNNVENVYLQGLVGQPLGTRYSVTVVARAVNINAVTAHPGGVVQDYALVISSGNPRSTASIAVADAPGAAINLAPNVQAVTNGLPLLNQRVGANAPYLVTTNGITNQWKFFVVTNQIPEGEPDAGMAGNFIAFRTFLPPNLGGSRLTEADIDLYVSDNSDITNLNESVISAARRGVGRGGSESIVLSNVSSTAFFYAGVKSEDQQAANFGFFAVSSSSAFSSRDADGNVHLRGFPLNVEVPDGAPDDPQAGLVFAFNTEPIVVQNVVVTNRLTHEAGGDLFGVLEHNQRVSILNGNRSFSGTAEFVYDDSGSGEFPDDAVTDSPGTLRNFVGEEGLGGWQLTMVDSAPFFTGQVNRLEIRLEPRSEDLTNGVGVLVTIRPGRWWRSVVDVPADATNLLVCVTQDEGPVEVYLGRGFDPDRDNFDTFATIAPPGGCFSLTRRDVPPLSQGRYFIGVFNPNAVPVNATIRAFVQRDLSARTEIGFRSGGSTTIFDDATTNSVIRVNRPGLIADLSVGVRIDHPRVADLVMHLVSPGGTRVLLAENRGGPDAANFGFGVQQPFTLPVVDSGSSAAATNVITTTETEGIVDIDYEFFQNGDTLRVYYEDVLIFDSGRVSGSGRFSVEYGPGSSTNLVITMNEQGNLLGNLWNYTVTLVSGYTFAIFTDNTNLAQLPIKFAATPYTNFNAFITNFVTNATAVVDGFEDGVNAQVTYASPGFIGGTGWEVSAGTVTVTRGGTNAAPWFILPDGGFRFLACDNVTPVTIVTNFATTPGLIYRVSLSYARAAGNSAPSLSVQAGPAPGLPVQSILINGLSASTSQWSSVTFDFTASSAQSALELITTPLSSTNAADWLLVDSVRVVQVEERVERGIYLQPEEPMTLQPFGRLIGEQAFGDWTLEITDNRVGGAITNAALLAWKLNITYVNTNPPAVTLTNSLEFCSVLGGGETAFFMVDLPLTASAATNVLLSSRNASLLYSATGLPEGQQPPDTFFRFDDLGGTTVLNGAGWFTLDRTGALIGGDIDPQIRPGRRYFLAVRNEFPDTNAICIRVDFESSNLPNIISLNAPNNCRAMANAGQAVDYFSFDVSTNAIGVEFTVGGIANGDVDLYVRRGLPLPTTNFFAAASVNTDPMLGEYLQVADLTQASLAGRWYATVVVSANTPDYVICAREIPGPVTPLTINVTNQLTTVSTGAVQYYQVVIPEDAFLADFQTMAPVGNVDLFISTTAMLPLGMLPTNAPFAGANGPGGDEAIQLSAFDPSRLLTPGTWYLAVVNRDTVAVDYSVVVRVQTTNINYVPLSSGVSSTGQVAVVGGIGFYRFEVSPGALQAVFETFGATDDVDLYVRTGFALPPPSVVNFDYSSANGGTNAEWIALTADNPAALPTAGTCWIAVVPKPAAVLPVDFQIRATEILSADVLRLFDGIVQCGAASPINTNALNSGVQFFRFDVSSNAAQAGFEITSASGDVDLYVRRGLPLTNFSLQLPGAFDPSFTNNPIAGLGLEAVCLLTNSAPVTVAPGTYYLAVVNRETTDVSFCVRAHELRADSIVTLSNRSAFTTTASLPGNGIDYYRYTASTSALQVIVEVIQANANVELLVDQSLCTGNLLNPAFLSTNAGTAAELVILSPDSTNAPLVAGDWYIAVTNSAGTAADYTVRVTEITAADIVTLTNQISFGATVPGIGSPGGPPLAYYRYTVSAAAARAQFEILFTSDDVNLIAKKDLPLPTHANVALESSNFGTNQELITITGSSVVALSPGDWYLAVRNDSTNDAAFAVMASEFTSAGTNTVDGAPIVSATQLCLSLDNAVPGVYYHVDGKASLSDTAWIPLSQTILATNTTVIYCVSLPTPYAYFRFVEGLSPKTIAPPVSFTLTSFTPSGLTLEWAAPSGTRFVAEYTETLFPPNWQPYPDYITSTNNVVTFVDDGTQTAPLGPTRYYRFFEIP